MGKDIFKEPDDCSFGMLYHQIVLLIDDPINVILASRGLPQGDDNALLLYGYVDPEAGMSFEVLSTAFYLADEGFVLRAEPKALVKLRYDAIRGRLGSIYSPAIFARFMSKVQWINLNYRSAPEIEQFREIRGIDPWRHEQYPDDIYVVFSKEGLQDECIWCHVSGFDGTYTLGRMLNEPHGSFGCHEGDLVRLFFLIVEGQMIARAILE